MFLLTLQILPPHLCWQDVESLRIHSKKPLAKDHAYIFSQFMAQAHLLFTSLCFSSTHQGFDVTHSNGAMGELETC